MDTNAISQHLAIKKDLVLSFFIVFAPFEYDLKRHKTINSEIKGSILDRSLLCHCSYSSPHTALRRLMVEEDNPLASVPSRDVRAA